MTLLPLVLSSGHALHDLDPAYRSFSRSPKMAQLFRELQYQRPLPVQSMHICKVSCPASCALQVFLPACPI